MSHDVTLSVTAEQDQAPASTNEPFLVMTSLKAPFYEEAHRAPIDVVTVIDRSGSMGGDKIALVKETLGFVVKQLKATDRISIVIYDECIETPLPLTKMTPEGKKLAEMVVSGIEARGSTDLCGGLIQGIDVLKHAVDKSQVTSVLLLTDGLANHGVTSTEGILAKMGKDLPCSVHTFGFGSDHDANMLKAIADNANGMYFFLKNKDDIPISFADCLGGLLSVVGQNITLTLKGLNGVELVEAQTKFKTAKDSAANTITISLGDIQSEEERDLLCAVKINALGAPLGEQQILHAALSYFNVIDSRLCDANAVLSIARPLEVHNVQKNYKVDLQKNRIAAASAIAEAKKLGDANDLKAARALIEKAISLLEHSLSKDDDYTKNLIGDLKTTLNGLQDRQSYTSYGGSTMNSLASAHYQQRSAAMTSPAYETSSRVTSKAFFSPNKF